MKRPESDLDEKRNEREAFYFRLVAGALCVAALTMGLLNAMNIIHI